MDSLEYGKLYIIDWRKVGVVMGRHVQTRGNDQDFPCFETVSAPDTFGAYFSTSKDAVVGLVEENGHNEKEIGLSST